MIFRDLSVKELTEFQQWARESDPPNINHWEIYHPVCRQIWIERGIRPATKLTELKSTGKIVHS